MAPRQILELICEFVLNPDTQPSSRTLPRAQRRPADAPPLGRAKVVSGFRLRGQRAEHLGAQFVAALRPQLPKRHLVAARGGACPCVYLRHRCASWYSNRYFVRSLMA
ncbi:MAG TPA: hypothetical protein VNG13_15550 [Mycobacteriales bacterium]|nr:hypothetical protein [Mycobacteriales bacterium]